MIFQKLSVNKCKKVKKPEKFCWVCPRKNATKPGKICRVFSGFCWIFSEITVERVFNGQCERDGEVGPAGSATLTVELANERICWRHINCRSSWILEGIRMFAPWLTRWRVCRGGMGKSSEMWVRRQSQERGMSFKLCRPCGPL
jgi:hypothetical protein